jgi:outer membrane protein assembly factor BamB
MKLLILLSIILFVSCQGSSENWPAAAGPNGNWITSSHKKLPHQFSVTTGKNILWKSPLPEGGQSGITLWEDKIFLSIMKPALNENKASLKGADILALCLDASNGKILWEYEIKGHAKSQYMYGFSDSSTPSPITDGKKVWFTNASGRIACLDFSGELVWERQFKPVQNLDGVHFPFNKQLEPFIDGDILISMEPYWSQDGRRVYGWNYLYGLDKNTGKLIWISEDGLTHYNTPFFQKGRVLIGRGGPHKVPERPIGYSMIDTQNGKKIWRYTATVGQALYHSSFNDKYALWFTENNEIHVLNPQNGQINKKISLTHNIDLRSHDGKEYRLEKNIDYEKEYKLNVFPAWYTNILIDDNLFFMCFKKGRYRKNIGPDYTLGKVNLISGKVEYLQVPVFTAPNGESTWNKEISTDTINSRGLDVSHDKRSRRDGWHWNFNGNPICVNNKLYFTSMLGTVYCIDTQTPVFDASAIISVNDLGPIGKTWSVNSPSYANGKLYHRTLKNLICIGLK